MNQITLSKASVLTSPNPFTLVCTNTVSGETNLAAVSWWTYLSFHPEMVGFCMSQKSFSGEQVRRSSKVVLAMPGSDIAEGAMKCGTCSGRDHDKSKEFGIEMISLPGTDIQVPAHTRCAVVCTLEDYKEVGDHFFYICKVDAVYGEEAEDALFAWNGYKELKPAK